MSLCVSFRVSDPVCSAWAGVGCPWRQGGNDFPKVLGFQHKARCVGAHGAVREEQRRMAHGDEAHVSTPQEVNPRTSPRPALRQAPGPQRRCRTVAEQRRRGRYHVSACLLGHSYLETDPSFVFHVESTWAPDPRRGNDSGKIRGRQLATAPPPVCFQSVGVCIVCTQVRT